MRRKFTSFPWCRSASGRFKRRVTAISTGRRWYRRNPWTVGAVEMQGLVDREVFGETDSLRSIAARSICHMAVRKSLAQPWIFENK